MEENKEKSAPLLPVPQFQDCDQKGVLPELSKDFSKISLEKEEELMSNTTCITNTYEYDHNFHDDENHSSIDGFVDEVKEDGETQCGLCGKNYRTDEFWICCDFCEKWYHGQCVEITPAMSDHMKRYKCPICCFNKNRASAL